MNDTPNQHGSAGIIDRAKAIITKPDTEWPVIAAENDQPMQVFVKYVVPLAAVGPVAALIGGQVFGYSAMGFSYNPSLMSGLTTAITTYVLALVSVWIVAWVANFVSPKFDGQDNFSAAFRLVAYAMTASMLAGIFGLIPSLSILGIVGLYSLYLLYKGTGPMMNVPAEKAVMYTVVTVVAAIVANIVIGLITAAITGTGGMASDASTEGTMNIDMGPLGSIQASEDGATATFVDENGEEVTITVDNNE